MLDTSANAAPGTCGCGACSGSRPAPVAAAAIAVLDQCAALIRQTDAATYCGESRVLRGGTIGKHVRHTLDHFRAAIDGFHAGTVVDYDRREREVPMEQDPAVALEAIESLKRRLAAVGPAEVDLPIRIRVMLNGHGEEAELNSTLGRELAFAAHHAVHHQAMLGAIAAEHGIELASDFGKAPSTINHERTRG